MCKPVWQNLARYGSGPLKESMQLEGRMGMFLPVAKEKPNTEQEVCQPSADLFTCHSTIAIALRISRSIWPVLWPVAE
jgi:hypothetical protein